MPFSRGSFSPRDQTPVSYFSCIDRRILYASATWEAPEMSLLTPKSLGHTHITARPALWEEGLHRDAKHGKVDERLGWE